MKNFLSEYVYMPLNYYVTFLIASSTFSNNFNYHHGRKSHGHGQLWKHEHKEFLWKWYFLQDLTISPLKTVGNLNSS